MGNCILVGNTRKWGLEVVGVQSRAQVLHLLRALLRQADIQVAQQILNDLDDVIAVAESKLSLDVPVLLEVSLTT